MTSYPVCAWPGLEARGLQTLYQLSQGSAQHMTPVTADVWFPYDKGKKPGVQFLAPSPGRALPFGSPAPSWARCLVRKVIKCISFPASQLVACLKLEASGRGSWKFQFVLVASKPHSWSSSTFTVVLPPWLIFLFTSDSMTVGTTVAYRICLTASRTHEKSSLSHRHCIPWPCGWCYAYGQSNRCHLTPGENLLVFKELGLSL